MSQYYYRIFGVKFGPISLELLQHEIASGQLLGGHEVRAEEETDWTRVSDFVAQQLSHLNPVPQDDSSILTWDGGHDDTETGKVAHDDHSTRSVGIWFCHGSRVGRGPYHFDDLLSLARSKDLVPDDELSLTDHGPWIPVRSIERLMAEMPHSVTENVSPSLPATYAIAELASEATLPVLTEHQTAYAEFQPVLTEEKPASAEHQAAFPNHQPELGNTETRTQWYVRMGNVEHGPIEFEKLIDMAKAGRILPMDCVRQSDQSDWTRAQTIPALFSSNSIANQSGSAFSLKSVRPTLAVPHSFTQKGYSAHVVPIPPVMPAPLQHATHPSWQSTSPPSAKSTAQQPAPKVGSATSSSTETRTLIGSSGLTTASSRQASVVQPTSPHSGLAVDRRIGTEPSSGQTKTVPPRKVNAESKHKLRRGQFKEPQLIDGKNLIMAVGAILALLFAWRNLMTASADDFVTPYGELGTIYSTLDEKRAENPTMELWAFARKEVVYKIESVKQKIRNINSKHPVRNILLSFGDSLVAAARSETHEEVTAHMQDAFNLFIECSKEFRKMKDEEFQKELQRKRRTRSITTTPAER